MSIQLNPYLSFSGNAREAMEFYASVLGGELSVMAFADLGGMGLPEAEQHLVMHSALTVSDSVAIMGSDSPSTMGAASPNGTVSLSGTDATQLRAWWNGLSDGGEITTPLFDAPWGDAFGQFTDKFGVAWMFNIATGENATS